MINKEGWPVIFVTVIIVIAFAALSYFYDFILWDALTIIAVLILLFHFFFFRDPDRETPQGDGLIISPADGHVIKIDEVDEVIYFKERVRRISIFLSVFDVHVNRMPVSGKVDYVAYKKGKFLAAFADDASHVNEMSLVGVDTGKGRILFKQIAGLIARRIIYNVKEGDTAVAGERYGLIRYGSRVDMFFPLSVKINVKLKQAVRCGSTIIGEF